MTGIVINRKWNFKPWMMWLIHILAVIFILIMLNRCNPTECYECKQIVTHADSTFIMNTMVICGDQPHYGWDYLQYKDNTFIVDSNGHYITVVYILSDCNPI